MLRIDKKDITTIWDIDEAQSIEPFGDGHINDTYQVKAVANNYILQRVNKKVFNTPRLVSNYELLTRQVDLYHQENSKRLTPDIHKTRNGVHHYIDSENYAWRLVEFISGAKSYEISPVQEVSYKAAKAIGEYQLFLNTIDPDKPCDTIKKFHDLPGRLNAYEQVLEIADSSLLKTAFIETSVVNKIKSIVNEIQQAMVDLPVRVTHNDTKLGNILFVGDANLVIDLDTVMKGYVMYDFGDMVRSFTSPALEDEPDISKIKFRIEHFDALTKGYLEVLKEQLSIEEKETLVLGAIYIIYEQVIRFLADYLAGDVYYKTSYPEHNLVRTRSQLVLLKKIMDNRSMLERFVRKYS